MDFELIVIGAGVNGSSAAYHSAKAGHKTALVEQFPIPHSRGSSGGQSRIIRLANLGLPEVSPLMQDSFKQWIDIEKRTAQKLYRPASLICILNSSSKEEIKKVSFSLERSGITPTITDSTSFNRSKGTSFGDDYTFIEDSSGGILMADKCLLALQSLFRQHRGTLYEEFDVARITRSHDGAISVSGPKGELRSKKLIICAGPWTNKLLGPLGLVLPLRPVKVAVHYWEVTKPFEFSNHAFADYVDKDVDVYGLPSVEYPGLMKVCYHGGPDIDPDKRDLANMEEIKEKLCKYVSKRFPNLKPIPVIEESCIYTLTPDKEMILDRHPLYNNIVFGCGFSGTGFKTGPAVGRTLYELAEGLETTIDVGAFRANRFPNSYLKISKI